MVEVIDSNNIAITCLTVLGWNVVFFVISATLKIDKVTDFAGGTGFTIAAILTLCLNGTYFPRQIVVTSLQIVWSLRLALFLLWRILQWGEDNRFDDLRKDWKKLAGFWIFQWLWNFLVSMTVIAINSLDTDTPIGVADIIGYVLWGVGFFFETVGDIQKTLYKTREEGKSKWCDIGLWKFSRHPNYFGEFTMWWGMFISGVGVYGNTWRWVAIVSPLFTFSVIMFLSGINLQEQGHNKKYGDNPEFHKYKHETSNVIPFPNALYKNLPAPIKTYLLFDYPLYYKYLGDERGEETA